MKNKQDEVTKKLLAKKDELIQQDQFQRDVIKRVKAVYDREQNKWTAINKQLDELNQVLDILGID